MSAVEEHGGWPSLLGTITDENDLTRDQAAAAMADILAGGATPAQIAGLIVALRMKGETIEEMTGLVTSMLDASEPLSVAPDTIDIVGTGGSAHRRTHALNISTMACIVAAAAGARVCKHGNRKASSTSGSFDFLEAVGVNVDLTAAQLEHCVGDCGVGFAFARSFHPAMRFAGPVRVELGIPTVFNVLGPLAHPGRVARQVVGTSNEELAAKMAAVLLNLGSEASWVVSGHGGLDELSTTGPSVVFALQDGAITRFEVAPGDVGLSVAESLDELAGGTATDNARVFEAVLDGREQGAKRDVVVLNAAAGLVVAGRCDDLGTAVTEASAAIDDGRAEAKLKQLVELTQSLRREPNQE